MTIQQITTHTSIDQTLCGTPLEVETDSRSVVELTLLPSMCADGTGLVHGGFLFGLADYAAMLAVNRRTVVLAGAKVSFRKPAVAGDVLTAYAAVDSITGPWRSVRVEIKKDGGQIFEGEFTCMVPERHVLDGKAKK
ncbi:MAG: PaaI family thioesterase [Spirochaetes bacterium]|nr:MAG: PaaI family thioesterase [Spirochaetota bacterium]